MRLASAQILQEPSSLVVSPRETKTDVLTLNRKYRTAQGTRLGEKFGTVAPAEELRQRREFAQPTIIGKLHSTISQGERFIMHSSVMVKPAYQSNLIIPPQLEPFGAPADTVAHDVMDLYGLQGFSDSSIRLIAKRDRVEPETAHRAHFSYWHTHLGDDRHGPIDLLYGGWDFLPTEYENAELEDHSLVRAGAEIRHRSRQNNTGEPLTRTWFAFIVTPNGSPHYNSYVNAKDTAEIYQKIEGPV